MFKGVSQVSPRWCALLFAIQPLPLLSLTPLPPTTSHFSAAFSTHPYILYLHVLWYAILLMLSHSLLMKSYLSLSLVTEENL
jgi:hypothetical protein